MSRNSNAPARASMNPGAVLESRIPVSPISLTPARDAPADFVYPRHLDRFKDFLAGMFGVILEFGQFHHPAMQVGEADGARIDFGVGFGEFDCDIEGIRPLHCNDLPTPRCWCTW